MEYLGHDLTSEGIKPTERLVRAIVDFPTPTDDTQVRRFVALAGYYRRFVPEFGTRMAPLTSLLRKSTKWDWGAAQEEAFAWAKAWLSTKPVLIYPDYPLPQIPAKGAVVECRRRKYRTRTGRYVLEFENEKLEPAEQDNDQETKPTTQQKDGPVTKRKTQQ
ncbi:Retrovirus Polyprotein [Phytophthora palmivora]|uniref:Retrovirus Polyprotein n=1 Tax=Phytophthora palmivora TaxID=4796 RepID=A0A2P4YS50_9STRA|nr:Retrovirus Polyprotein [Phytophthora palmivora]